MSDKSMPLLSDAEFKESDTEHLPLTSHAIDVRAPLSLSAASSEQPKARKELISPRSQPPSASSPSPASSYGSSGFHPARDHAMAPRDNKARCGIPYQVQIFLRSVLIVSSLTVGAWSILRYAPEQWYLSWLPMFAFAGIGYMSFFPRNKWQVKSYLRVVSLLVVVSAHQSLLALPVIWLIRALTDDGVGWRYALLTPYFFGLMVFGRLSPVIHRHDPRSILIHILYDPPALLTCFVYSVILKSPLNRLYTPITERLVLGSLPFKPDAETLSKAGVSAVVNMCAEYAGPVAEYNRFGIEQCRLPTTDMSAPTLDDLRKGVAFITQHLERDGGKKVMVHCKNGMSRSACVVVSFLCASEGLTPIEAVKLIKQVRGEVSTDLLDYPSVQEFCSALPHVQRQQTKVDKETAKVKAAEEEQGQGDIASTINQRIVA